MKPPLWLALGRVSNLPTVWTNALAGTVLAGADPWQWATVVVCSALSLLYVGGMYLNDAFDAAWDRRERPERPIPSGQVRLETVYAAGFGLLLGGLLLLLAAVALRPDGAGLVAIAAGLALAATILFYDWRHKENPLSPLVMGLCRVLAYVVAGLVASPWPAIELWLLGGAGLCWLIGLTYAAKQEAFDRLERIWPLAFLFVPLLWGLLHLKTGYLTWLLLSGLAAWLAYALFLLARRAKGDVTRAVAALIAGIALVDALFLAAAAHAGASAAAVLCFLLTLAAQRWIAGS